MLFSKKFLALGLGCSTLILSACTTTTHYGNTQVRKIPTPLYYKVQRGDSLSKIGQKYGLDYVSIAQLNQIPAPYNTIHVGQRLRLKGATSIQNFSTANAPKVTNKPTYSTTKITPIQAWRKPTVNNYIGSFNQNNKALYYFGQRGAPIYATQDGIVVYSEDISYQGDLAKFGNLILIQHDNGFVSVYAHNDTRLVKNGDSVKAGQQIATMGTSGLNNPQQPTLAFQLRQSGHHVDASKFIPN